MVQNFLLNYLLLLLLLLMFGVLHALWATWKQNKHCDSFPYIVNFSGTSTKHHKMETDGKPHRMYLISLTILYCRWFTLFCCCSCCARLSSSLLFPSHLKINYKSIAEIRITRVRLFFVSLLLLLLSCAYNHRSISLFNWHTYTTKRKFRRIYNFDGMNEKWMATQQKKPTEYTITKNRRTHKARSTTKNRFAFIAIILAQFKCRHRTNIALKFVYCY